MNQSAFFEPQCDILQLQTAAVIWSYTDGPKISIAAPFFNALHLNALTMTLLPRETEWHITIKKNTKKSVTECKVVWNV